MNMGVVTECMVTNPTWIPAPQCEAQCEAHLVTVLYFHLLQSRQQLLAKSCGVFSASTHFTRPGIPHFVDWHLSLVVQQFAMEHGPFTLVIYPLNMLILHAVAAKE